jgi:CheY-like chemotaxis protein
MSATEFSRAVRGFKSPPRKSRGSIAKVTLNRARRAPFATGVNVWRSGASRVVSSHAATTTIILSTVVGPISPTGSRLNSELGYGCCFRLYLPPLMQDENHPEAERLEVQVAKGGNECILVVEDNEGMRRVVAKQLAGLGYRVFEASDAAAAIAMLRREPQMDLLFTDIVMPGGRSGAELARDAKALIPRLRVLLTSGFPQVRADVGGWPDDSLRLLNKPYRRDELARVMREVLDA